MSDASETNSSLVLYDEGADPEADLVLVCGEKKFFVRRAVCEMAFPVVADSPDKSNGAEFVILGHSAETLENLLLLVNPDGAIALTPELITEVSPLAHFLGSHSVIHRFYLFLQENSFSKRMDPCVAAAAFALDKLLSEEPKWEDHVLTAMVRFILPRPWYSEGKKLEVITDHVKGIHASTTVALFQHVARKFTTAACFDLQKQEPLNVVECALHEHG